MRRLIPEAADERTRLAMLRLFYEQSLVSLVAAALLVLLHAGYARGSVPMLVLVTWALAFLLLLVLRARWRSQVRGLDQEALAAQSAAWQRRAQAGSAATGVLWSTAILMVFRASRCTRWGCWRHRPRPNCTAAAPRPLRLSCRRWRWRWTAWSKRCSTCRGSTAAPWSPRRRRCRCHACSTAWRPSSPCWPNRAACSGGCGGPRCGCAATRCSSSGCCATC